MKKVLIGGQALRELGSTRHTEDLDYLIFDENNYSAFIFNDAEKIDYMNGNGSNFAEAIWNKEKDNEIATPQSLFELKVFAFMNQIQNKNFNKINTQIHDLNFLKINFEINETCPTLAKFHSTNTIKEVIDQLIKL